MEYDHRVDAQDTVNWIKATLPNVEAEVYELTPHIFETRYTNVGPFDKMLIQTYEDGVAHAWWHKCSLPREK